LTFSDKWNFRFLELARIVSTWSKDPSTKTGAVLVRPDKSIISVGYNGFAPAVDDTPERYNNRDIKYEMIIHCEENAMIGAHSSIKGSILYTWPFMSCSRCAARMIKAGVAGIVTKEANDDQLSRWAKQFELATQQFNEAGVSMKIYNKELFELVTHYG
jgi:dCMP deaminase